MVHRLLSPVIVRKHPNWRPLEVLKDQLKYGWFPLGTIFSVSVYKMGVLLSICLQVLWINSPLLCGCKALGLTYLQYQPGH